MAIIYTIAYLIMAIVAAKLLVKLTHCNTKDDKMNIVLIAAVWPLALVIIPFALVAAGLVKLVEILADRI